jgi:hypothetical protein
LAGGPNGGWRYLVDSNLDWGQDLGGLKQWMDENEVDHIWLSYFGEGRPDYYGITTPGWIAGRRADGPGGTAVLPP